MLKYINMKNNDYIIISGKNNPKIVKLSSYHDRKKASKDGVVYLEGKRLCEDALISGNIPRIIACDEKRRDLVIEWINRFGIDPEVIVMTEECFAKISSTVNPQGIAMTIPIPSNPDSIPFNGNGEDIYVVLENVQDPGNLGTIIRLADAFAFTCVVLTGATADIYNEKVLRSSMGSVWHIPIVRARDTDAVFSFFNEKNIITIAAELGGEDLNKTELTLPAAYFIGNEGNGLDPDTISRTVKRIKIPMKGKAESLNAASATSIMGYVLSSLRN